MRALVFTVLFVGSGCTSATDAARITLKTATYATVQSDKAFAESYRLASEEARNASSTQEEKDARMADWDRVADDVERVLEGLYTSLATAEIALDAWEETDDSGSWDEALACLAVRLRELEAVLFERNVKVPVAVSQVLRAADGLVCEGRAIP